MSPAFTDIFQSSQFTFFVGEAKEPIFVHAKAFAGISDPLDRLINGDLREASDKYAELLDIDKGDFLRLCEFVYRGKYTGPDVLETEPDMTIIPHWFGHDNDVSPADRALSALFTHARMYCLADRYLVRGLKEKALNHLDSAFNTYVEVAKEAGPIVDLIRFTYDNSNARGGWDQGRNLRETVVDRLGGLASRLDRSNEFQELIEEGGEFVVDYWRWMRKEQREKDGLMEALERGYRYVSPVPSVQNDGWGGGQY
ncbi:hypothetical protein BDV96DRAFT_603927 [Lophiotrema nucula]|uniref:BTB domain-containing protein n=1 Tax=Lophiotrema nucula TaxID=690887 RepID=A0A6A5YTL0_9PLEO|nr:hypothetical protein BDV96DRAFT_603927 [Lophiotrema nucula]